MNEVFDDNMIKRVLDNADDLAKLIPDLFHLKQQLQKQSTTLAEIEAGIQQLDAQPMMKVLVSNEPPPTVRPVAKIDDHNIDLPPQQKPPTRWNGWLGRWVS